MASSKIEWTNATWNPSTGCTKISPGCKNCYAEKLSKRLKAMGVKKYCNEFEVTLHREVIPLPKKWKTPSLIFVNSMSDLFHEDIPVDFIQDVFETMRLTPQHTYQILTKRSERLLELDRLLSWPSNVWMGVTVENVDYKHRIDDLRQTNAKIKFLSLEPLISAIPELNLRNIHWVIVGGESGPGARPIEEEWVLDIRDQCLSSRTLFFFKQWGGVRKKKNGRLLQGKIWNERPVLVQN
jgi:protein gp37